MLKTFTLICMLSLLTGIKSHNDFYSNKYKRTKKPEAASISILPTNPLIEKDQYGQYLNFDITIKNTGNHVLDLNTIEVSVMDLSNKLILRKSINNNGQQPGIKTIGNTIIKPGESIHIFNPFYTLAPDASITFLKYRFLFNYSDNEHQKELNQHKLPMDFDVSLDKIITPRPYLSKTNFYLPLKDKLIIWDARDFYSHHRMFQAGLPQQAKGITANSNRYAYDLVSVDEQGNMYQADAFKKENWYAFGKSVYAPAAGRIIEVQNTIPDNEFSGKMVKSPIVPPDADPLGMGNHVIIDHGNGEFSALLHMEKGSIKVRIGEMVKVGQQIGNIGFSGDAIFPHLHYTIMNGPKESVSEGIPSYFNNYKLFRGTSFILIKKGHINSGDIIESEK